METDRKGSKTNLNESTVPLLDDQESKQNMDEKEKIELAETRSGDSQEKDDSAPEKDTKEVDDSEKVEEATEEVKPEADGKEKKKKEKKEKKEKQKKEKTHTRTCSYADQLTVGLNLLDRDEKHVNDHVNLVFEDVIAEPDASHGIDGVWKGDFILFSGTKEWVYKIFAAILSFPLSLVWGLIFAFLTVFNVWIITPVLRLIQVPLSFVGKIWSTIIGEFLDPVFSSISLAFSRINVNNRSYQRVPTEINDEV